jgi:hypothetical protein
VDRGNTCFANRNFLYRQATGQAKDDEKAAPSGAMEEKSPNSSYEHSWFGENS